MGVNVLLFLQEKNCTQGWKSACKVVEGSSGLKPSGRAKRIGEALVNGCGQLHKGVTIDWPCVMNSFSGTRFCAGFDCLVKIPVPPVPHHTPWLSMAMCSENWAGESWPQLGWEVLGLDAFVEDGAQSHRPKLGTSWGHRGPMRVEAGSRFFCLRKQLKLVFN